MRLQFLWKTLFFAVSFIAGVIHNTEISLMRSQTTYIQWVNILTLALVMGFVTPSLFAQNNNTNNNNNNNNVTGLAGVNISPMGVIQQLHTDTTGRLDEQQAQAALMSLSRDVATPSPMRYVALAALERELVRNQGVPTEEMKHLAGLTRITHVFIFPESREVVIAGPAEGWIPSPAGMDIGYRSGLPTLELQDLVVALRAFPPGGSANKTIGCSIDPTEEGLANLQQYVYQTGGRAPVNQVQQDQLINGMVESLGLHDVTVLGVPANTHFAQVMVAADYRMKLIGLGLENPPVKMVKYIDKATPNGLGRNALIRWYFVPDYESARVSEDGLGLELVGLGLKLVGENEVVSSSGARTIAQGKGNPASLAFQRSFTQNYPLIAKTTPVYAQLRNLTDMLIVAAYFQKENVYDKCNWNMAFLGSEKKFAVQNYNAPQKAESAVAAVWKQNKLMTPIAGGVDIDPSLILDSEKTTEEESVKINKARQSVKLELKDGQWWWDQVVAETPTPKRKK